MNLHKVLIANRGEIAARIIRACHLLGLDTVAIYSDADRDALHVRLADEAFYIGASEARASYLDAAKIIATARRAGADAIHPGYGFLAENAEFAGACVEAGLSFIGPSADFIAQMGSKISAKVVAEQAGVPIVPGYHGEDQADEVLKFEAKRMGLPILIKASAGGGGRGMRQVYDLTDFESELKAARQEAEATFGDGAVLLERFIESSRHIEVQVLGDKLGNILHLFERDCSLQRNHQKVIEEAPAPNLSKSVRQAMLDSAIRLAAYIGYDSVGTIEYIFDAQTEEFFFLEMNTRLQVEHPVTEIVTGIDLVEWQLRVAGGEALPFAQEDIHCKGWAVEARVAAEDTSDNYRPQIGTISAYLEPVQSAVRVDSGVCAGSSVSPFYDSMLAKVVAYGCDRLSAIRCLRRALGGYQIHGVGINTGFLIDLLDNDFFTQGKHHTGTITTTWPDGWRAPGLTDQHRAEVAMARLLSIPGDGGIHASPWCSLGAWRVTELAGRFGATTLYLREPGKEMTTVKISGRRGDFSITLEQGNTFQVNNASFEDGCLEYELDMQRCKLFLELDGDRVTLQTSTGALQLEILSAEDALLGNRDETEITSNQITAPMPGMVAEVLVSELQEIKAGQAVIIIEAMKLFQTMVAPIDGVVKSIRFKPGDPVENGAILIAIESLDKKQVLNKS